MATAEKEEQVAELKEIMAEAKSLFLADYTGIDVAAVTELRNKLRESQVQYRVIKNRLAIRAAEEAGGLQEYPRRLSGEGEGGALTALAGAPSLAAKE